MKLKSNFDEKSFKEIEGLRWNPWIGSLYDNKEIEDRLLIVGESHYAQKDGKFDSECYNDFMTNRETTRNIVERVIREPNNWSFFHNANKALLGTDDINKETLWSNVAFYNLIQRPMKTIGERPNQEDYYLAWKIFYQMLKILKPSHCIVIGNGGTKYIYHVLKGEVGSTPIYELNQTYERIGKYWGKTGRMHFDEFSTDISFIKHTSQFFVWQEWNRFLTTKHGDILRNLKEQVVCSK